MSIPQKSEKTSATDKIAGLSDIEELEGISPRDLWADRGAAFPGVLMSKFKRYKQTCSLIRSAKKEQHRVLAYLEEHSRLDAVRISDFDNTGTLSHLLMLHLVKFEEESDELPPLNLKSFHLEETDAERKAAFSQDQRRTSRQLKHSGETLVEHFSTQAREKSEEARGDSRRAISRAASNSATRLSQHDALPENKLQYLRESRERKLRYSPERRKRSRSRMRSPREQFSQNTRAQYSEERIKDPKRQDRNGQKNRQHTYEKQPSIRRDYSRSREPQGWGKEIEQRYPNNSARGDVRRKNRSRSRNRSRRRSTRSVDIRR